MSLSTSSQFETSVSSPVTAYSRGSRLRLRCPLCRGGVTWVDTEEKYSAPTCPACAFTFCNENGIWKALSPGSSHRFARFVHEYQTIRAREGRGGLRAGFYLGLPYKDISGRNAWQWAIRGRSYRFLEQNVLPQIERNYPRGLDVLDVGAGNGWMSYRLTLRGHRTVAVDLLTNARDGLGAAEHFFPHLPKPFPRFQAEMDRLPFGARQFDLAVFNASFHYSEDYERTFREILRCVRRPGHVLIVDSPWYSKDESGRQMVVERHGQFEKQFGFRSDSIPSREYLTREILRELAETFGFEWRIFKPWYGLGWALRPLRAKLFQRREPSKVFILWAPLCNL